MSVSSLESLPNEILRELFERYINGVDILNAFLHQQNQRFDNLIRLCQRFSLHFIECPKEQYLACINQFNPQGIFPVEKVVELALSEENATGQVTDFLSLSPPFDAFRNLRKLYVHSNEQTMHEEVITQAIRNLQLSSIETLSLRMHYGVNYDSLVFPVDIQIRGFLDLKRLFLYNEVDLNEWFYRDKQYPRLRYFTYSGSSCEWTFLPLPFHCCPQLRYLNIEFTERSIDSIRPIFSQLATPIVSIPNLQTLILSFKPTDTTQFNVLSNYLLLMPNLQRLQIKAHSALLNATEWENLLEGSLPSLTHFRLQTTTSHIQKSTLNTLLDSFETPFWREKDFYFIITEHKYLESNGCSSDDVYSQPITSWWIVPFRALNDDKPTNHIHSFAVCGTAQYLSNYYNFSKIQTLLIENLDASFLQWLQTHMNFSSIEYLDLSHLTTGLDTIQVPLPSLPNLTTLQMSYQHLHLYLYPNSRVKYLHVTDIAHEFETDHLRLISQQYPKLEHLTLHIVRVALSPVWRMYLPNLRSLTYLSKDEQWVDPSINYLSRFIHTVRFRYLSTARRLHPWKTIWIDERALSNTHIDN